MAAHPLLYVGIAAAGIAAFLVYRKGKRSKMDKVKDTIEHASEEMNKKLQDIRSQTRSA